MGGTGNGKSSIGNAFYAGAEFLDKETFTTSSDAEACTTISVQHTGKFYQNLDSQSKRPTVRTIDNPGV
mgnify:CR=1 FL=1